MSWLHYDTVHIHNDESCIYFRPNETELIHHHHVQHPLLCVWGHGHLLLPLRCPGVSLLQDLLQVGDLVHGQAGDECVVLQEDQHDGEEGKDEEGSLLLSKGGKLYGGCQH